MKTNKAYRIYHIEEEYVPADYIDEDGYIDDYYDDWIYHDITDKYVDCIEKYENFCETKREEDDWTEYLYEEIIID